MLENRLITHAWLSLTNSAVEQTGPRYQQHTARVRVPENTAIQGV
jgi:hypothetical protein